MSGLDAGAIFDLTRKYRYLLWREIPASLYSGPPRILMATCLNPSTADETVNDATVAKMIRLAGRWGYSRFLMTNLYGWRSTDPDVLPTIADPVGPENDIYLEAAAKSADMILAAWGTKSPQPARGEHVKKLLQAIRPVHVLVLTKNGHPGHPLYLPEDTVPQVWA